MVILLRFEKINSAAGTLIKMEQKDDIMPSIIKKEWIIPSHYQWNLQRRKWPGQENVRTRMHFHLKS
jgi:hypothetical protein